MCLYAAFEVASTLYDVGDLAVTAYRYSRGRASRTELAVTGTGVLAGMVGAGGGYGRAARSLVREGASDLTLWKQLASSELMEEARRGVGTVMAGAGHRARKIDAASRLVAQYGGDAEDWAKMSTRGPNR